MSDLDDELLQVAGQAGRVKVESSKRKRAPQMDSDSEDVSLDDESDWEAQETASKRTRTKTKLGKPTTTVSTKSADMGVINQDDLIEDDEDRARLAKMTELEREMELADRAEKRQQELQRAQLLRAADRKDSGSDDDGALLGASRRSGREVREEAAKRSAIEELRAARERQARGEKARRSAGMDDHEEQPGESDKEYSQEIDDIYMEEGEAPQAPGSHRFPQGRAQTIINDEAADEEASFEEVKSLQIRRYKLEEWIDKPHFELTLPGCIVRLAAGKRRDKDGSVVLTDGGLPETQYLVAQVLGVEERQPGYYKYLAESGPGWKTPYPFGREGATTSKWLRVLRGQSEKSWPLAQVSNGPITEEEFSSWHKVCERERQGQITRGEVENVRSQLFGAENYVYSAEDVAKLLQEKRAKGQGARNVAIERARLERERDGAAEAGDEVGRAQIQAELEALAAAEEARNRGAAGGASMANLNRRNAERNFQTAFRAKEGGRESQGGGGDGTTLDPFSRRATRSMIYWKTKQSKEWADDHVEEAGQEQAQQENGGGDGNVGAVAEKKEADEKSDAVTLVDLSALDLSLLDLPPPVAPLARKLLGSRMVTLEGRPGSRTTGRTITLAEYHRRNGSSRH